MANYMSVCRTNYFQVKDEKAFEAWAATVPDISVEKEESDGTSRMALFANDGWPQDRESDMGNLKPFDIVAELRAHLEYGEVAVMLEVGGENHRYLLGAAVVISQHRVEALNLEGEAMRVAKEMAAGRPVTLPRY